MRLEFSFDDAHKDDLHIARLLKKHGFRGIFYVPFTRGEDQLTNDQIEALSKDHDIGFHSFSHPPDLKLCEDIDHEVSTGKEQLEEVIGRPIESFCYPKGKYDERVIEALKNTGYKEARTVDVMKTDIHFDPFRKPTTVHLHPKRREYGEWDMMVQAKSLFMEAQSKGDEGYYHVFGHGWELSRFRLWWQFDELLQLIRERI